MNSPSKILLVAGLLAAPLALVAKSPESAYVESYRGRTDIPVPVSVVMPSVEAGHVGEQLMIEFVVDATGKPTSLTPLTSSADSELVTTVLAAVAQWQFNPALVDGKPVSRKVALPVVISDEYGASARFAMN